LYRLLPPHYRAVTPKKGSIQKLIMTPAVSGVCQQFAVFSFIPHDLLYVDYRKKENAN
jgi:hypothetical protein